MINAHDYLNLQICIEIIKKRQKNALKMAAEENLNREMPDRLTPLWMSISS